jgi:hypothetical protein
MKKLSGAPHPMRRQRHLLIDSIGNEVLIYDLDRHNAHCLNHTADLVWRHCDGKSTASEIARRITNELGTPFKEEMVWLALKQLERRHLLETPILVPALLTGLNRREMVRAVGIATVVSFPLVSSIVSPTPGQASTCAGAGAVCGNGINCCFGHICSNGHCT